MLEKLYNKIYELCNYEKRESQLFISQQIIKALQEEKLLLVEATTGSGKTLSYLLPCIIKALENNLKIVISTNTINLQDQIIYKELPLLEKILKQDLNYTLIKGRNNYICKRKLMENETLMQKYEISKDGDKSKVNPKIPNSLWEEIKSDKDTTLAKKCPYYSSCYYYKIKNLNEKADIFIVNHHILALDKYLKSINQGQIIPNYDICVIDEAHELEDILRIYFSNKFSFKEIYINLGMIYNRNAKKIDNTGLFLKVCSYLDEHFSSLNIEYFKDNYIFLLDDIYDKLRKLEIKIRKDNTKKEILAEYIFDLKLEKDLKEIFNLKDELLEQFLKIEDILKNVEEQSCILFINIFNKLIFNLNNLEKIFEKDLTKYIYWIKNENGFIELNASLYNISEIFNKEFNKNVLMFSATLTVNNSFEYIKNKLGITNNLEYIVESNFDYENQMNILIPNDLPLPTQENFKKEVSEFCLKYLSKHSGRAFILFTSYYDLNYTYEYFKEHSSNLTLLKQGDYDRSKLIEKFKNEKNAVLFGTDSFWQGVDVKGEALSIVIIVKLPFQVPDDPIVYSICKRLNEEKSNSSFMKYQLPYAILKMKQGVGRLIRSEKDKGNILILDKRIIEKNYGRIILKSLPNSKVLIDTSGYIIDKV